MLEFEFKNVGGNNPHQMKIIHSKYGSLTTLHMTHEEAEDLFYKLTAYKDRCERIGGYDDPKLEGVKEPSERSRSPSNQSNLHSCLNCFHFHKNNYDHFKRYEKVKKENNYFTCRAGKSVKNPEQNQECFISRSENQSLETKK